MEAGTERTGFRSAPLWLRLLAGLFDLGLVIGLSALLTMAWYRFESVEFPVRYWNHIDYLVDVFNTRLDLALPPVLIFFVVFLVWETLPGRIFGNSPVARLMGMRICTNDGHRPGVLRLAPRAFLNMAGSLVAMAGPLTALVHPRRKMLHDILTGCLVLSGPVPSKWIHPRTGVPEPGAQTEPRDYSDGPRR